MKALLIVDVQNDFCPGGALAVPGGDEVIAPINYLMPNFDLIVATQDWHPENHCSFAVNHGVEPFSVDQGQTFWPVHCVQNTEGAKLHPELKIDRIEKIWRKGNNPDREAYSPFFDDGFSPALCSESYYHPETSEFKNFLVEKKVKEVYVCGLAIEYCVWQTAVDAKMVGFNTFWIPECSRGIIREDIQKTAEDLEKKGVKLWI